MPKIISLGSINVDRIHHISSDVLEDLTSTHAWFPDCGETVIHDVGSLPSSIPTSPDTIQYGGKGANQAIAATNAGADATLLGAVGSDSEGTDACDHLSESGVNISNVQLTPMPTGTADILLTLKVTIELSFVPVPIEQLISIISTLTLRGLSLVIVF